MSMDYKFHTPMSENWGTPDWLYEELDEEFSFELDVAPRNSKVDFLTYPWEQSNFCNPPYSSHIKNAFVKKAIVNKKKETQLFLFFRFKPDQDFGMTTLCHIQNLLDF